MSASPTTIATPAATATGESSRAGKTTASRSRSSGARRPTGSRSSSPTRRLDDEFELDVAGADALAAFYHPFAFAAAEGLCLRRCRRAIPSICSRRSERSIRDDPSEALEEPRGPHGPLERQPLEDRRLRLARVRRHRRCSLGHAGRHEVHRPQRRERRRVPHRRSHHRRRRLHGRREGREHRGAVRDRAHPVQDADASKDPAFRAAIADAEKTLGAFPQVTQAALAARRRAPQISSRRTGTRR